MGDGWTEEYEKSFLDLKDKLVSASVLAYANFSLPFILEIDASFSGLGVVLSQEQDGRTRPVAYASHGLCLTERNMSNYSSMNEFLALKWAMTEKFRDYLLGQKCIVWTDNNPLRHLDTAKLGATEQRWAPQLAAFDFTIRYRPSRTNVNADALSRMFPAAPQDALGLPLPGTAIPPAWQQPGRQDALQQVVQAAVFALPSCSVDELSALQCSRSECSCSTGELRDARIGKREQPSHPTCWSWTELSKGMACYIVTFSEKMVVKTLTKYSCQSL